MHHQIEMLFLLAKPESGADCLRCLAGRLSFQSQGERRSRTAARWAPGGCAANGPSSAKQKGKRRRISALKIQSREEWEWTLSLHWFGFWCVAVCIWCSVITANVHLTLSCSFKIKKMKTQQRMFTCRKQQVNTVLYILPGSFYSWCFHMSFSVDVYTQYIYTGFDVFEMHVCVCVFEASKRIPYICWADRGNYQNVPFNPIKLFIINHFALNCMTQISFLYLFKHISSTRCNWEILTFSKASSPKLSSSSGQKLSTWSSSIDGP